MCIMSDFAQLIFNWLLLLFPAVEASLYYTGLSDKKTVVKLPTLKVMAVV